MAAYFIYLTNVILSGMMTAVSIYGVVSFVSRPEVSIPIAAVFCVIFAILGIYSAYQFAKSIKKLIRYRKIMKKGLVTYGVVVEHRRTEIPWPWFRDIPLYNVKVVMEDKSVRLFLRVKYEGLRSAINFICAGDAMPCIERPFEFKLGEIVKIRYYDNEIVMIKDDNPVGLSKEDWDIIEGIKKKHNLQ